MAKSAFVLFGSTGSLAKEKIIPAINSLYKKGDLENIEIIFYARREVEIDANYHFIKGELNDLSGISDFLKKENIDRVFFYVSLPPTLYPEIINSISKMDEDLEKVIALEKPFGTSLKNAQALAVQLKLIPNSKIYLVDHYLAKEPIIDLTKQDITKIKNIKIAILETVDVAERGEFFDSLGMIKDVGQNHMLNILSKVVGSLNKIHYKKGSLELAQYKDYLETKGVRENSQTETYFKADFVLEGTYMDIEFIAGKMQKEISVFLNIEYLDGSEYKIQIKPPDKPFSKEAHEYIIEDIIGGKEKFAVPVEEALKAWKIIEEVLEDKANTKIEKY